MTEIQRLLTSLRQEDSVMKRIMILIVMATLLVMSLGTAAFAGKWRLAYGGAIYYGGPTMGAYMHYDGYGGPMVGAYRHYGRQYGPPMMGGYGYYSRHYHGRPMGWRDHHYGGGHHRYHRGGPRGGYGGRRY